MKSKKVKLRVPDEEGQLSIVFTKGGPRQGAGRKGFGVTKKISLTLSKDLWDSLDQRCSSVDRPRSEVIREMIEAFFSIESESKERDSLGD